MRRVMLAGMILAAVYLFGNTLGMAQQSGITSIAGGRGGNEFSDVEPAFGTRVTEVRVRAGNAIDAVQMIYAPTSGRGFEGDQHGGNGGNPNIFRLDPDEYVIGIAGRYGDSIDSLRIITNKRTSANYGGGGGDRNYRIDVPNGCQAIGFTGRSGERIDAIGLVYIPISRGRGGLLGQGRQGDLGQQGGQGRQGDFGQQGGQGRQGGFGNGNQSSQTQLFGGRGGNSFSDQDMPQGARIAEIRISGSNRIDSVQMIYVLPNGRLVEGERHGNPRSREFVFRLDRDEYVVGLSGRIGVSVDSLVIQTNKRTSQTFGGRGGDRDYRISVPAGSEAIGFAGRSGDSIDAIGLVHARMGVNRR